MLMKNKFSGVRGLAKIWYQYGVKYSHMVSTKAKYKARVLAFFEKHGEQAALDAFNISRSTLYLWKKQLKEGDGDIESLNEASKAPKKRRKRTIDERIIRFIIKKRTDIPKYGKEKLADDLKPFCRKHGLTPPSASTVGRILTDLKATGRLPRRQKLSMYGSTGRLIKRKPPKKRAKQRRNGYQPHQAGDLVEIDTIVKYIDGVKRYILTAIDVYSSYAFAYAYKSHSSRAARDFMQKLEYVTPFSIRHIQTDNGSEFEKHFRTYIENSEIVHFHTYPKRPKMNAHVERFNRTVQEEFADMHLPTLAHTIETFNERLVQWLLWYNSERPHWTQHFNSPLNSALSFLTPQMSNMSWTNTHY